MPDPNSGSPESVDQVLTDLDKFYRETGTWNFYVGQVGFSARLSSMRIAHVFLAFHVALGVVGALMVLFLDGSPRDLGIAFVVGALFSLGAMISQMWAIQMAKAHTYKEAIYLPRYLELRSRYERAMQAQVTPPPDSPDTTTTPAPSP